MTRLLIDTMSFFNPIRRVFQPWRLVALLAVSLGLAGCQTKIGGPLCPQVSIASELADLDQQFNGLEGENGAAAAPQTIHISLSGLHGNCRYNDMFAPSEVEINTTLHIDVTGVKAGSVGPVGFRYFIATVKSDQSVVERREFAVEIPQLGIAGSLLDEPVQTRLQLRKTELGYEAGSEYRLIYGLVMTENELRK
ncbi:MAG: hypothetical protein ORO03_07380 [Alphaproteobacteria bacterium]|nr:hypothetical protein [Alphaproteobacteria bacterium]